MNLLSLIQQINIEEKMENAPDKGYEIGLFIGSMLPFVFLVVMAYLIFRYQKKRLNREDNGHS